MEQLVRAKTLDGQSIEGCFCRHEFVKAATSLTEAEKAGGTPIPPPVTSSSSESGSGQTEPTEYVVIREAVQTLSTKEITVKSSDGREVKLNATVAVFTEIVQGSAKAFTGFTDKDGKKIFEGDKIRYQASISSFETYTVVFTEGKFTVSPAWLWGCNFTPFDKRKCTVIAQ